MKSAKHLLTTAVALGFIALLGCSTVKPKSSELLTLLQARDTQPLDLAVLGHNLVRQYGEKSAEKLVLATWAELTKQPTTKAGDVMWLASQSPRVRDVAWLVNFRSEWLIWPHD